MNEETYKKLKEEVEEAKAASDRAQGSLSVLAKQLKEEFQCENIKEAKKLVKELGEKREKAEAAFEKAMKDYEAKWKKED